MRKPFILMALGLALLFSGGRLQAKIVLPKVIGHNMVLQRHKEVSIWGSATKGETVTVLFAGQKKQTVADADGKWEIKLSSMEASDQPRDMVIAGTNSITLHNILVGEVWLCSGQSNMEYAMRKNSKLFDKVKGTHPTEDELQTANNPNIRIFLVRRKYMAPDSTHQGWDVAAGNPLRDFSAAGYFCAKELYAKLHIPIGMISSAVPGSRIEPWIEKKQLEVSPRLKDGTVLKPLIEDGGDPGKFYDTMISPVIPYTLSGFFWYQGESACFLNETIRYAYKFKTLINNWRTDWKDSSLPFYFVEIAPYAYSAAKDVRPHTAENLPEFWESQALALKLPNTAMTVITDLVDSVADLHPGYKWEVGRRLALLALNKTYGMNDLVCNGPIYSGMKIVRDKIEVSFTNMGNGLASREGKPLNWFSIAGADGKFYPADAVIKNNKVVVASPSVKHPAKVRFAWNEGAQSNFINKEGLPAAPFRSDNPWENLFE